LILSGTENNFRAQCLGEREMAKNISKVNMVHFYQMQMIAQCEQMAAQIKKLNSGEILNRRFHKSLNQALYDLSLAQGIGEDPNDIPF
jgi:hypothetical protein